MVEFGRHLESMGKTCHEQTVASDLTVINGNIEHVSWVLLVLSEVAAPGNRVRL